PVGTGNFGSFPTRPPSAATTRVMRSSMPRNLCELFSTELLDPRVSSVSSRVHVHLEDNRNHLGDRRVRAAQGRVRAITKDRCLHPQHLLEKLWPLHSTTAFARCAL